MSVVTPPPRAATLDDLMRAEGKAELIRGRIVTYMPSGDLPSTTAFRIARRLADHVDDTGSAGVVYADNMGFAVAHLNLSSGRQSFSPDASYYTGPRPANPMRFVDGPPDFAVEVRSEGDYGPAAERAMADKRADYFEAGTLVVWDVDPDGGWVDCYRSTAPSTPQRFGPGDTADAEPAVPGWRLAVDWLMRP